MYILSYTFCIVISSINKFNPHPSLLLLMLTLAKKLTYSSFNLSCQTILYQRLWFFGLICIMVNYMQYVCIQPEDFMTMSRLDFFLPVFMWELVCYSQSFVSSHPRFQLSFHSDAGGTKQLKPLKCKFSCAVWEADDNNWGSTYVSACPLQFTCSVKGY